MAAKITSPLCLAFFHLPKLSLTIFECFSGFPQPRWGFFVIANPTGVKQSFFCRQDCHGAIAPRNDVPLAWIATALSRLAMTGNPHRLPWCYRASQGREASQDCFIALLLARTGSQPRLLRCFAPRKDVLLAMRGKPLKCGTRVVCLCNIHTAFCARRFPREARK